MSNNIEQLLSSLNRRAAELLHLEELFTNRGVQADWSRIDLLTDRVLASLSNPNVA
jgi:hypothetical protein